MSEVHKLPIVRHDAVSRVVEETVRNIIGPMLANLWTAEDWAQLHRTVETTTLNYGKRVEAEIARKRLIKDQKALHGEVANIPSHCFPAIPSAAMQAVSTPAAVAPTKKYGASDDS